ncbi:unnamed protein product [Oppiella nova]|uniref:NADH:flavin oxidoreductase/NADH oxidase N-terminal domain-containing protein n=1 Tax=Oppiella nova TaxID=334625 RepID=A0A7R9M4V7_9ACAR|nr:unnamed protein product [Oppiella nova]CAG2170560.1 unnamed protein product [Oppiella nova]
MICIIVYITFSVFNGIHCDIQNNSSSLSNEINKVPELFTPLQIRNVTLRNRICVTPMSMYSSVDGMASDFHFGHLQSFALGGAALVMTEATAVAPDGRISPKDSGLWKDQHIPPFARIVQQIKTFGAVPGVQLGHAGRKGPSPLAYGNHIWKVPKEATLEDLQTVRKAFVSAAGRAVRAGFEILELHFGNGYLVHQFLSPITNKRTDSYGGSLENRMRLALEIAGAVRQVLPETVVLGVRVSVSDLVSNGWDIPQTIELAKELKKLGVDFLSCSSGQLVPRTQTNGMNKYVFQVPSAGLINRLSGIMTAAVGQIIDPKYAEKIVKDKTASLVMIGRAMLNNPHWPYHAADVLGAPNSVQYPDQYGYVVGDKEWRDLLLDNSRK